MESGKANLQPQYLAHIRRLILWSFRQLENQTNELKQKAQCCSLLRVNPTAALLTLSQVPCAQTWKRSEHCLDLGARPNGPSGFFYANCAVSLNLNWFGNDGLGAGFLGSKLRRGDLKRNVRSRWPALWDRPEQHVWPRSKEEI